jgi:single-strand DNA-binding protein
MTIAKTTLSGIIVTDPEKRFTPNNHAVTNFDIQVNPAHRNDTPFTVRITCWRGLAEIAAGTLQKGMPVVVEGRLQVSQYDAPGGISRRYYEIDASHIYMGQLQPLIVPNTDGAAQQSGSTYQAPPPPSPSTQPYTQPPSSTMSSAPMGIPVAAGVAAGSIPPLLDESLDDIPF